MVFCGTCTVTHGMDHFLQVSKVAWIVRGACFAFSKITGMHFLFRSGLTHLLVIG